MKTAKFTSSGELKKDEETAAEDVENNSDGSDESDKADQLNKLDYGYREQAMIDPEEDCFHKMAKAFEKDPSFNEIKSNLSVVHSRFAEVRRYYHGTDKEDVGVIPLEHAHPNLDDKERIALFHNGFIANFDELKKEVPSA